MRKTRTWINLRGAELRKRLELKIEHRRVGRAVRLAHTADPDGQPYVGLHPHSLLLDAAHFETGKEPYVNLVMATVRRDTIFAGVRTALRAGALAAEIAGLPLRVISFKTLNAADREAIRVTFSDDFGMRAPEVIDLAGISRLRTSARDRWIATYWTTAHCLQLLAERGRIDVSSVIYLVQEYEPSFYAASTDSILAEMTYHSGFVAVVNSEPLAGYLRDDGIRVPENLVFRPELDWNLLEMARAKRLDPGPTVLFYHRPFRASNMDSLGIVALRQAARQYFSKTGLRLPIIAMGSSDGFDAGPHADLDVVGRLGWAQYFDTLNSGRVLLSLQATPHPSHPPLDMVAAGGRSVTNELRGTRGALHPRLVAAPATPEALANALLDAAMRPEVPPLESVSDIANSLGAPLGRALGVALGN